MIGLGVRLAVGGGREALIRLLVIAAAVAIGVGLLLGMLATMNGVNSQNQRYAWLNSAVDGHRLEDGGTLPAGADPLWWRLTPDMYQGRQIGRVDVAATGPHSPVPPGIPRLPAPGEYYASPALAKLLATVPAAQLGDRYPGHLIGTIGNSALPGPDSLAVVIGWTPAELSTQPRADQVGSILTLPPQECDGCVIGAKKDTMDLIIGSSAVALIFPVMILVGTATRLAAARREQRFAAMRLVGATPRQVSVLAAVESMLGAVLGTGAGFLVYLALRPAISGLNVTMTPFFDGDLSLGTVDVPAVALGVPVAAAVAALVSLRRVRISPLGVSRRATPKPPRAWRVLPMALGVAELAYFIGRRPDGSDAQMLAYMPGMLLIIGGLVFAGPWLTMAGARLLARLSGSPSVLIAGRRLADDPKAGFRSVSGLVLALCVTTGTVGIMTSLNDERGMPRIGSAATRTAITNTLLDNSLATNYVDGVPQDPAAPLSASAMSALQAVPGVTGVLVLHTNPLGTRDPAPGRNGEPSPLTAALADCRQLAAVAAFHTCAPGAETASVPPDFDGYGVDLGNNWPTQWQAAAMPAAQLADLPVSEILVGTDGSSAALEQSRTLLMKLYPRPMVPWSLSELRDDINTELAGFQQLAAVIMLVSLVVAGCSLAVGVAGGLTERRRPFSLLRLTGTQLSVLRRTVLLESAVPLLLVSALAIGMGFVAAQLFLQAQLGYSVRAPGSLYYVTVALGLAVSLAVIASTLPLLRRITGPESARND
ncbi:FtsX-like permease family protein [Kitasatospora viridis]|uniref:FtsX-like permease family protein n=1 Tax=Kitasatospora viridis TaxID=281105 RepID=A0A561UF72_9ACTN|nr:FtsX-like permease family protein [Kitasatospora viridis]TWF97990.1 FtsX-like permease family protein [Kitasatospora viridis]